MPHRGRTPAEAIEHSRGRTVRLLSCVTSEHIVVSAYYASDVPQRLELSDTAKLRGAHPLRLDVAYHWHQALFAGVLADLASLASAGD
jgi:hypothetical protein